MKSTSETWLFSYGTLRNPEVQRALFGRTVECIADSLPGFTLETVRIANPAVVATSGSDVHPMLRRATADGSVNGAALKLDRSDLAIADSYEVDDYARIPVLLASGRRAFAYVHRDDAPTLVGPDPDLARRLLPVARRIFADTFAHRYDPVDFAVFCDATYLPGGSMDRDLADPAVRWRIATMGRSPIGYAKLTPLRAPAAGALPGALELQQVYVLSEWHGSGIADQLMAWAIGTASGAGVPELYLTVFDHNERAKRFYRRWGFEDVGCCTFELGGRIEEDRIWRRTLTRPAAQPPETPAAPPPGPQSPPLSGTPSNRS